MDDQEISNVNTQGEIDDHDDNAKFDGETNTIEDQFELHEEKTIDHFINEQTWDKIGKNLEDYDEDDMDMLRWKSLEDCIEFYYTYAKVKGFGVRKDATTKSRKDGHVISKKLVCRMEGHRHEKWLVLPDRKCSPKPFSRFGCSAFIQFKFIEEYKFWKVGKFHGEHNHPMVHPKQVPYIRSFRGIPDAYKIKIKSMHKSGIAPNRIMQNFVNDAGSRDNVPFLTKDLYNYIQRIKREEVEDGDAETVMAFLFGKKANDPSFYVNYTRDGNGNLEKLFWSDGISRKEYKTFGHVLAFDTTYKCNAYNKPFVVLVGVNHHRNTVPFGCALVVHEKQDTFAWVLEQMIEVGDGYKPLTVITDGDKAMALAIKQVLPDARHRLCLWHLMRNVKVNGGKKFAKGFLKCVYKCRTPDDFEKAWKELIKLNGFESKKWATELYEDKEKWAEAYLRGYCFAGMRSTQRCEGMHRTLKRMLDKKVMLYRFVEYYMQELDTLRWEEGHQEYKTTNEQPCCKGVLLSLKKHALKFFTRKSFMTLSSEMSYEGFYLVKDVNHSDQPNDRKIFWLQHVEYENYWYLVIKDNTLDTMYCCCMKLEAVGYPCRHMFVVLKYENVKELPRGCIMKRWTIYAKEGVELNDESVGAKGNNEAEVGRKINQKIGIGDPIVVENGRGQKKKKARVSESPPSETHDSQNQSKLDLNKTPKRSPSKVSTDMNSTSMLSLSDVAMTHMPNTYEEGDVSESSYSYELENMEDDPTAFDWKPNQDW